MASLLQMNTASTSGSGSLPSNTVANPKGELKAITTRSGLVTDGPTILTPPKFVTLEVCERVEETYTNPDLAEYTIKVPPPPQEKDEVQIQKFWQMFKQLHLNITLAEALVLRPKCQKMLKDLLSNKEKLQELANTPLNENCSAVILKKLPEKLGDPVKFLIPCGFSELKCKALADLGASINLMPLFVWKELGLLELIPTLINIFNVSSEDFLEVSVSNQPSGNPTFLLHQELTSLGVTHDIHDSEGCNGIHPYFDDDPLSGSTTYLSNSLLEEFTDEFALFTYPPDYDDNLQFDINFDLKE
nr:hypothetical protein [Tanacetum cinerariifolium]